MATLKNSTAQNTQEQLTLFAGGSHANRLVLPGSKEAQMTTDTSGRKCLELYGRSGQGGLLQKTFLAYLIGMPGWLSTRCYLTWKMKAIRRYRRLYFQLVPSMPRTEETEFSLLPTPVVPTAPYQYSNGDKTKPVTLTLVGKMKAGLLPTPTANPGNRRLNENGQSLDKNGNRYGVTLNQMAKSGLLPTPAARDIKGTNGSDHLKNGNGRKHLDQLPNALKFNHLIDGHLNHRFVMEMMGFPSTWTDLKMKIKWEDLNL